MNFKADASFLDKITMGAIGARKIVEVLNQNGHEVIELERYSTRNKIWATKIKRLRLPDLICLKCGKRIEARAKNKLEIRMSDNENKPDRRWDVGLRDNDLIAFIRCNKTEDGWVPAQQINLFETASLRQSRDTSKLADRKSSNEGSEQYRIWPTVVPRNSGRVLAINALDDKLQIQVTYSNGKKYTFSKKREKKYQAYCQVGDDFTDNDVIIAGTPIKKEVKCTCKGRYDFLADLSSTHKEIRYAGVKALGYLEKKQIYINSLRELKEKESDKRIILEIYSSLVRLGEDVWEDFEAYALALPENEYRLEYVLIMSELNTYSEAQARLCNIAKNSSMNEEMRSAAAWGIKVNEASIPILLEIARFKEDNIAAHAIAHIVENYKDQFTTCLFDLIGDDISGGIVLKVLTEVQFLSVETLVAVYKNINKDIQKKWCAMTIGILGKEKFSGYETVLKHFKPAHYHIILDLWEYSAFCISASKSSKIEFLKRQNM